MRTAVFSNRLAHGFIGAFMAWARDVEPEAGDGVDEEREGHERRENVHHQHAA